MRISRKKRPDKPLIPHFNINERITVPEVRVLDHEGKNVGVMTTEAAIARAFELEMDLVEINPKANPPVAQIIGFSHFKYQKEKQAKKQKVQSHVSDLKGVRLSIAIGDHDLEIRLNQSIEFLGRGDKIKPEIILHGRENAKPSIAFDVLKKFYQKLSEKMEIKYEQEPTKQGNKVTSIIIKK
jgi:translation initiation factor IF-3